jgi:ABC-type bacteriocin/lantibiotic exporter with double-glycine peptidase domain
MALQIKTITLVLAVLTYISTSVTAIPIGLALILAIMSVSTFKRLTHGKKKNDV